ncbi:MAG TPA: nuclease-related domain-containing protein [Azonexus sp.]|nr:nuclease-related domain-containing protein [Azonexus sp.]
MLIKSSDNKTKDIDTLQGLLNHPAATAETKRKIEQEIRFMLSGVKGEKDAAYEIEFHYGPSKNWAVIHDLRIEHKGRVAQIDHILVNRFLDVWVCESKRFSEGIAINEHSECSAF